MIKKFSNSKQIIRNFLWIIATILIVFVDQLTKFLVDKNMQLHDEIPLLKGFFNLYYVRNKGAGLGLFANARWVFISVTTVVIIAVIYLLFKRVFNSIFADVSLVFILAGGIGNMIDRLCFGEVIDFFQFQIRYFDFIFNVADIFVTFGTIMFLVYYLFFYSKESDINKDVQ